MDRQIGVYLRAARQLGYEVRGVGYDAIGRPDLRPLMATPIESRKYTKATATEPSRLYAKQRDRDETPDEFFERCLAAIVGDPQSYYQRATVVRFEREHEESAQDTWQTGLSMRDARRLNMYPRNPDACIQWNRACEFLGVCAGEQSIDDPLLFRRASVEHEELEGDVGGGMWVLTQSSIRTYASCPRKYKHRYVDKVRAAVVSEPLRAGKSIHRAIEVWRKGGTVEASLAALDQGDPYANAKERAMFTGYVARWGKPKVSAVEMQFEVDLVNPESGGVSRTFRVAGKFDAVFDGEEQEFLNPSRAA